MEAVGALVLSIILAIPFLPELRSFVIVAPKRLESFYHRIISLWSNQASPEILQYYPKESISFNPTSDSKLIVAQLRSTTSSPTLTRNSGINESQGDCMDSQFPAIYSSSFVRSERTVPVLDISWNYEWYRFKAFEASLRGRYGVNYPPGEVILNSMQLNLPDSRTKVVSRRKLSHGLFDFLEEAEPLRECSRILENEYLNPLDHFVVGHRAKALTEEKSTETKDHEESIPPISITRPTSPIANVLIETTKEHTFETRRIPKINDSCIPQYRPGKINSRQQYRLAHAKFKK